MKDESKDILAKAIADLKQKAASSVPPQDLVKDTLAQLAQAQSELGSATDEYAEPARVRPARLMIWSVTRLAAAAVVLIAAGYAFGRITAPQPDMDELRAALLPSLAASLEPAIRERVVQETTRTCQQAMVAGYIRLSDDLTRQYQADLNRFALQMLAASNTATNQQLQQVLQSLQVSQLEERQRVAAALEQIEARRAQENARFGTALVSLATQTETELQRMVRLLANTQLDTSNQTQGNQDRID
jgi:hypothetical protein